MQTQSRHDAAPVVCAGTSVVFREGVRVELDGDLARLTGQASSLRLRPVRDGLRAMLDRLAAGPVPLADLLDPLPAAERAQLAVLLRRAGHLLAWCVTTGGQELARIEPTARDADYQAADVPGDVPVRLSRFAFCRSRGNVLVLESALAGFRAVLSHRIARQLVAELGGACTASELAGNGYPLAEVTELLGHLAGADLVEVGTPDGRFRSDEDPTLRQWDVHDLLFHSRSRPGRYDDRFGATYPHIGQIEPLPAVKPPPDGPAVPLHRPSMDELLARDPALTVAIEGRRSVRDYDKQPMTAEQLGEFLYRVARVRARRVPGADGEDEIAARPYPSGGSAYDLELYLSVRRCAGLTEGIYYYDPVAHRLVLVNEDPAGREAMLAVASTATGLPTQPDVLITITSRFQRVSWRYRSIAYALTLLHTGVLYQTMYLVATAMGLAPCGLGLGDADLAARVLKLDYLRETSVGDFMLGSLPADDDGIGAPSAQWRRVNDPEWKRRAIQLLRGPLKP